MALVALAEAWGRLGLADRTEQLARTLLHGPFQLAALTGLAVALVPAGQPVRAEQVAPSIFDPTDQAKALAVVASALSEGAATDGDQLASVLRLVALILAGPNWTGGLRLLAEHDVEALFAVAHALPAPATWPST
jgi:hypothetical protein